MNSREKVRRIFERRSNGESAFWVGRPAEETIRIFAKTWGIEPTAEAIFDYFDDDCRCLRADEGYQPASGRKMFDAYYGPDLQILPPGKSLVRDAESVRDVEKYPWPSADDFDFTQVYKKIDALGDKMVMTGVWSPFFHSIVNLLGMEQYFIMMYEEPEIIDAITEHVVDFYVACNEKFFSGLGDRADTMFFGSDFGTQRDLIISPEMFRRFILPSIKRLVNVGKKYGKYVMMHSCGAIGRIIPDLIDAGIDVLHPLQAQAAGMSADELSQYKNDIAFVGGIDAQSFLVDATPEMVKAEVRRVRRILSPNYVISNSHEDIMPNVPPENIVAMAEAAREAL